MINEQLDKSTGGLLTNHIICKVVDNNDPQRLKRIKIRAPFLHDNIPDADLPWACPCDYTAWGNGAGDVMFIPKVGTEVICSFESGVNNPIYIGKVPTGNKKSALMGHAHYPNVWGFVDANGNTISLDEVGKVLNMVVVGDDGAIYLKVGGHTTEPAVLGNKLTDLLTNIISTFNTHTHTGNLGAPTTPPAAQMTQSTVTSENVFVS